MSDTPTWQKMRERGASPDELLKAFDITEPFVDVRHMAVAMDIKLEVVKSLQLDVSGELEVDDEEGKAIIRVLEGDAEVRQRFTIAHEIGHLMGRHPLDFLDEGKRIHRDTTYTGNAKEQEANAYAAELLVPFELLTKHVARYDFNVSQLACVFRVSDVTMGIRLMKWRAYTGL